MSLNGIEQIKFKIAVIGLGYVGLPLAIEFSKKFEVVGYDTKESRISELKSGHDSTGELQSSILNASTCKFTVDENELNACNVYIVTVPTPITKEKIPDLAPLIAASKLIAKYLRQGDLVIYESTVYPGATEEVCMPILADGSNLIYNEDFHLGYSPERINPGDRINTLTQIKKITSGSDENSRDKVDYLYNQIINAGTYKAQSIKVAEAAKVIENTQRDINIAFVNELSLLFSKLEIDTKAVLDAASTKWNFLNFRPGMVGGHCIGVDPYYLTHKSQSVGHNPELILAGRRINDTMHIAVAVRLIKTLNHRGVHIQGSKVLLLGCTFKEDTPDIRNSKVFDLAAELTDLGFEVDVYDPIANNGSVEYEYGIKLSKDIDEDYSGIICCVMHKIFDLDFIKKVKNRLKQNGVLFDLRHKIPDELVDIRL